ncbi:AdoMet-dependent methyltransferase predicted [Venturia nashicola]|uniref:tRNA (uracil-O(2)-)-methyltransferase n=1 Tax=Venturia nashicola TaxID=86259 RepID=A0A4Z1P4X6_9PEZI|nr:AdoMet-dependent methyltransferase predicted [Venturia nashicola]
MVTIPKPSNIGFEPTDLTNAPPIFKLPDEIWISVFSTPCTFDSTYFLRVVENTLKNPNVTSSCVFRADIFYDSVNDIKTLGHEGLDEGFARHMKAELRPKKAEVAGFEHQRTIVRNMVPRNPQLDKALVQTCHIFRQKSKDGSLEKHILLIIPHVSAPDEIPFYHPSVQSLALIHSLDNKKNEGELSVHYRLFPGVGKKLDNRLQRTALNFLKVVHKHGVGQQAGYTKRVLHDQIVPQSKFQDTYTRLKIKYAKILIGDWVEQTDPTKHVFEDLGIAAFLIELWEQMYGVASTSAPTSDPEAPTEKSKQKVFPGFVDIGCGNGVLVNVLTQEGYPGWGFDARRRKTWSTFPPSIQEKLKELVLVPQILQDSMSSEAAEEMTDPTKYHNGGFPGGTFIVSNHADELTAWTPLLAFQNQSPFIAIPCCSHDLSGTRTRFNDREASFTDPAITVPETDILKTKKPLSAARINGNEPALVSPAPTSGPAPTCRPNPNPSTGSLAPSQASPKQPSAYQSLTYYVARLATELHLQPEKEMLRIPSTRNAAIVGRSRLDADGGERKVEASSDISGQGNEDALVEEKIRSIVRREVGELEFVARNWMERARVIAGHCKGGSSNGAH